MVVAEQVLMVVAEQVLMVVAEQVLMVVAALRPHQIKCQKKWHH
jgi:hypothetical protein